jgi:hypothetical protein
MRTHSKSLNPDKPNKPSFSVHKNGTNQTNVTGVSIVTWSTEVFDTNDDFDIATYKFTPTIAGKYLLSAGISWISVTAGDPIDISIFKNGSVSKAAYDEATNNNDFINVTAVLDANGSTDYFEVRAQNVSRDTSGISGVASASYFTGCKID